jgi:hypothetical protein
MFTTVISWSMRKAWHLHFEGAAIVQAFAALL